MSPTIHPKYKYFHSTVQRAKYRRQKFHFCRLLFDLRPRNVKLNPSNICHHLELREDDPGRPLKTKDKGDGAQPELHSTRRR